MGFLDDVIGIGKQAIGQGIKNVPISPVIPATLGQFQQIANGFGDGGPAGQSVQGGGGGQQQAANRPNAAGHYPYNPTLHYIRSLSPGMSRKDAMKTLAEYQAQQALPGIADFVNQKSSAPNPNVMQMFFANTVAPYLKQAADQYSSGAASGTAAMQKVLSQSAPSPAMDVLKSWLPVQQAGTQQMGGALQAAAVTAPYYDSLLQQLQENVQSQQQSHADQQAMAAAQAAAAQTGGSSGNSFGSQLAQSLAGKASK